MIHDDGRDSYGDTVPRKVHNVISINELLDALEFKYDALREKLFKEMVPKHLGENNTLASAFESVIIIIYYVQGLYFKNNFITCFSRCFLLDDFLYKLH